MKLSYQWLKDYVDLPLDLSMESLSYDLTMRTVEVEGIEDLREKYNKIVVGRILQINVHPHADKLKICQVDIGEEKPVQIVCGGENLAQGHDVLCTLPGSYARWHGEGEPVRIEEASLRGESSYGMICGASEIGLENLFPATGEKEIVDLTEWKKTYPDLDPQPGMPIKDLLDLDDWIIEIENKSLTNRPDLWSHYGVARELAAIYQLPLKPMPKWDPPALPPYPLEIEDPNLCRRYIAAEYENVDLRKSPLWLASRLMKIDIRPKDALVDITNYIMAAYGNPTHAFDERHIEGGIVVRPAREGEELTLLDDSPLKLTDRDLVISDQKKAICLAGCMGGKLDSINENTNRLVLEIGNFHPAFIRKTAQIYGIRTEASQRFEKNIDTQRADPTMALADELISRIFPQAKLIRYSDAHPAPTQRAKVQVGVDWLSRRLGKQTSKEEVEKFIRPLFFEIKSSDGNLLEITAPSWRSTGDISLPDDILEEVARMIGYENFELKVPRVDLKGPVLQPKASLFRRIDEYLAFQCGFYEIMTYPWMKDLYREALGLEKEKMLELAQPPALDQAHLRSSLLPGILQAIVENARFDDRFRIFERAEVFQRGKTHPSEEDESLPLQSLRLGAATVGKDAKELFYEMKGILEAMGKNAGFEELSFQQAEKPSWADPKAWLNIYYRKEKIGTFACLSTMVKYQVDLKFLNACLMEIDVGALEPFSSRTNTFHPLPLYPHVFEDLSVLVREDFTWEKVVQEVEPLVESLTFIDEYQGDQIPEGMKSLTLRVELASDEGTLTTAEINQTMQKVRLALESLGAQSRS